MAAAARTVDAASDIIPPTTGSVLEITVFAVLTATASALPLTTAVNEMYAVNARVSQVISVVASHLMSLLRARSIGFSNSAQLKFTARKAYMSGIMNLFAALIITSIARQAAAYFAVEDVTAPQAAAAVNTAGIAARE